MVKIDKTQMFETILMSAAVYDRQAHCIALRIDERTTRMNHIKDMIADGTMDLSEVTEELTQIRSENKMDIIELKKIMDHLERLTDISRKLDETQKEGDDNETV